MMIFFLGVIKCKKDRSPSSPQQCPLCMNPRMSKNRLLAMLPAGAFLCTKPTIDPSLKPKSLTIQEDNGSASTSPQDFINSFGSLSLNMTDLSGNKANVVCTIQKPFKTLPIAFIEENDNIMLNMSFSTNLMCNVDHNHLQPVWQLLALYSDSPLILERKPQVTGTPQLTSKYKQVALTPEDIFTNIEADFRADPFWFQQEKIFLQLNRNATTLSTLQVQFSSDAQITLPRAEMSVVRRKWTMIPKMNTTKLEHTVLAGSTIALDCPGQGDPSPHLEWLLADGSKVRVPYVSEDGRILIDKSGKLELQMADSFDSGLYHCISTNYADADILTYRITVVEPYVEHMHENGVQQTVGTGETLNLPCHSTGIPDASISWILPGNTVLSQSSRDKKILNNGTLRILQVTPRDQGYYRCVVANPSGVDFSIFQVSVQMKVQRSVEHDREADGSGLGDPNPSAPPKQPPSSKLPTSALTAGAEAGKQVSSIQKKGKYKELIHRQRGDSTLQRFREQRRQFPLSARRIDPQYWAALLEKAKRSSVQKNQENTTVKPMTLGAPPAVLPAEEEHASGMISVDEEFVVLKTKVPGVTERSSTADLRPASYGFVTGMASGTEVSSTVNPHTLQSKHLPDFKLSNVIDATTVSKSINPTAASKLKDVTNQTPIIIFPSVPGVAEMQDTAQVGKRAFSQTTHPGTGGTMAADGHTNMLSILTNRVDTVLRSANPTEDYGHRIPIIGLSRARGSDTSSHTTKEPCFPKNLSDSHTAAPSLSHNSRNSTANFPWSRHFGRERTIWSRGRIISPYRTPVLRRHRYRIVRPALKGPANRSTSESSATEPHRMCPTCASTERFTLAATVLSTPGSSLSILLRANITGDTAEESTTVSPSPSLLLKNKQTVDIETLRTTIKYFRGESSQVTPGEASTTFTPTPVSLEKTPVENSGSLSVSSTIQEERDSMMTSPISGPLSKPSMPTEGTNTNFSRKKIPWHEISVGNPNKKGVSKNLYQFGLQKNKATMLPKIAPLLPTDHGPPSHPTTLSATLMQTLSVAMAVTHHNATKGARSPSASKEQSFANSASVHPGATSERANTMSFLSIETDTLAMPTASASVIISETQRASSKEAKDQIKEPPKSRNDPNTTPGQSLVFSMHPSPTTADSSLGSTDFSLQDTSRIVSTFAHHPETSLLGITELPQKNTQTLGNTTALETTLLSRSEVTTIKRTSSIPPSLSSGAPLMPIPSPRGVITDSEVTSVFKMVTNGIVTIHESSRNNTDLQQSSTEAPPDLQAVTGTTYFTSSNLFPSTPETAVRTDKAQFSNWKPFLWPENHIRRKAYSETILKGERPAGSLWSPLSFPEASTYVLHGNGQKHAESVIDKRPVQNPTSKLLPSDFLPKTILEKPRIIGGRAASFTIPANADAFLPCEAVGNPLPTIHWTRISSGICNH